MERHPFLRPSGLIFTSLAIAQAATWTVLTLIGILLHKECSPISLKPPKGFFEKVTYQMYQIYFIGKKGALSSNSRGREGLMLAFLILQLFVSAVWLGSASYQFYILVNEKYDKVKKSFGCCAIATLTVSILDLQFGCIMAFHLDQGIKEIFKIWSKRIPTDWEYVDVIVVGIMVTLAFRGFVLWLVNVVSSIVMLTIVYKLHKRDKKEKKRIFKSMKRIQDQIDQTNDRRGLLYPEAINAPESRPTLGFIVPSMVDMRNFQEQPNQTNISGLQIPENQFPNVGPRIPPYIFSNYPYPIFGLDQQTMKCTYGFEDL